MIFSPPKKQEQRLACSRVVPVLESGARRLQGCSISEFLVWGQDVRLSFFGGEALDSSGGRSLTTSVERMCIASLGGANIEDPRVQVKHIGEISLLNPYICLLLTWDRHALEGTD